LKFALPRDQFIGNNREILEGKEIEYSIPSNIERDVIYLDGTWINTDDDLRLQDPSGSIVLSYTAKSVNIVAGNLNEPVIMEVLIDDRYVGEVHAGLDVQFKDGRAFVVVDTPQLYNVYDSNYASRKLELRLVDGEGFYFNAFTFG